MNKNCTDMNLKRIFYYLYRSFLVVMCLDDYKMDGLKSLLNIWMRMD